MKDIGLRSYQDIVEPEYNEPALDYNERQNLCHKMAVEFFREMLEAQEACGAQLWFDWTPENKIMVYEPADGTGMHSGGGISVIIDEDLDGETESEIEKKYDDILGILDRWRDRKLQAKYNKMREE